jgi:hypothetical protein
MTSLITNIDLDEKLKIVPVNYEDYCTWLDGENENSHEYSVVVTNNTDIRDEKEWNTKGREIYNINKLSVHINKIFNIINRLNLSNFIVKHEYKNAIWFPKDLIVDRELSEKDKEILDIKELIDNKMNFIKKTFPNINLYEFNGGFNVKNKEQILDFISIFIDYPFLLSYRDVEMISTEIDLIIKFTHHITVDFITPNKNLIFKIKNLCNQENLTFIEGQ